MKIFPKVSQIFATLGFLIWNWNFLSYFAFKWLGCKLGSCIWVYRTILLHHFLFNHTHSDSGIFRPKSEKNFLQSPWNPTLMCSLDFLNAFVEIEPKPIGQLDQFRSTQNLVLEFRDFCLNSDFVNSEVYIGSFGPIETQ